MRWKEGEGVVTMHIDPKLAAMLPENVVREMLERIDERAAAFRSQLDAQQQARYDLAVRTNETVGADGRAQ